MTSPQRIMLFSLFNRACAAKNISGPIARDQYREQLTRTVAGSLISWNDFSNAHVDRMKAELMAIIAPADIDAQLRQIRMPRTRLLYSIEKLTLSLSKGYITKITQDKFGHPDLDRLSDEQLDQLRITLHARARARRSARPGIAVRQRRTTKPDNVHKVHQVHAVHADDPF